LLKLVESSALKPENDFNPKKVKKDAKPTKKKKVER
jgi:hypothetical protein